MAAPAPSHSAAHGIVKQVLSGDTIVIRDRPVDGPPPERTVVLSNISCGRVARRPTPNNPEPNVEDPFAWQAREFVRSKLVGKEVTYVIEKDLPSGRQYGSVYLGKSVNGENVAVSLLDQGLAELRRINNAAAAEKNATYQQLLAAEEAAKAAGRGRWSALSHSPRIVLWNVDEPKTFVDRLKGERLRGIVEQVRDGNSMQVLLLPDSANVNLEAYYVVWISLSGIRAPSVRTEGGKQISEPFGLDSQFFVESRLLQRDVVVLLESCQNQNFVGSILHPNGNIAELLLREGLAKCVEWSLHLVSVPGAAEAYRLAERSAKGRHLRLWQSYQPLHSSSDSAQAHGITKIAPGSQFTGTILEVGNGDNVTVKCSDGVTRKFFLSSVRGPKAPAVSKSDGSNAAARTRTRPLYDVPYAFEAREQLRAFVGRSVSVLVDYIQPKTATIPDDRLCCTVKCGTTNLAELLVSVGLATVISYRNSDDSRSAAYVELKAAEEQAVVNGLGLHSKTDPPIPRVSDLTNNLPKARQFLPFFKRTPRMEAVVEFVVHASRMRIYLPREMCIATLLLSGIQCPRKGGLKPDGTEEPDMPFSVEAFTFIKELCMQRSIEVTIEGMDRVGSFIGWGFLETAPSNESAVVTQSVGKKKKKVTEQAAPKPKTNLSVLLVSKGLAAVHRAPSTEASPYYHDLIKAEECAKDEKLGIWSSEEFVQRWQAQLDELGRTANEFNDVSVPLLPGGASTGYIDDISMLTINGLSNGELAAHDDVKWIPAQVTAISNPGAGNEGLRFYAQHVSDSSTIVQISQTLNSPAPSQTPNYKPKKNEIFAACFSSDGCWYRARIVKQDSKAITVQYVDFGNEESIKLTDLSSRVAPLSAGSLVSVPPQAREYRLAFVQLPPDSSDRLFAERAFANAVMNKDILLTVRFSSIPCANESIKPVPGVSVKVPPAGAAAAAGSSSSASNWSDVALLLIEEGLLCVEPMRPDLLKQVARPLLADYLEAQAKAKKERKNAWRYGDFRVDSNARE